MTDDIKPLDMEKTLDDIRRFLVLGSGTLGLRVGLQAALSGFDTIIYDNRAEAFPAARKVQASILRHLVRAGRIEEADADTVPDRIRFTTDPAEAAEGADFVSESVYEDLGVKQEVWRLFGRLCPPATVFTTNTSYLLPSAFAADTGRPERFCAFHFHDVFQANVVDVMPHAGTSPWVCDLLMDMGRRLGQTPVRMSRESPGYIFNTMLMSLIGAAGALVSGGVAGIEDVDRSWMGNFKMESGPFGILDAVGLDTAWHISKNQSDERSQRFAAFLKTYVDAGRLGVKTGEGFYTYPDPAFTRKGFIERND
jgi:3-hydroxybutyryl-CoA dehydrogenase